MNKPVAWYKKDSNDYLIENIGQPDFQVQEFIDVGYIPLYTHPVKELTNDEMRRVINEIVDGVTVSEMVTFLAISTAILRKASEK